MDAQKTRIPPECLSCKYHKLVENKSTCTYNEYSRFDGCPIKVKEYNLLP